MAAAFFRRRSCLNYLHRELCRVVWRPQAALYCSKPPDRKLPRITHIKKAKPQPAVDVAKLLEELFSQKRPGTAPPGGGKATKASTISSTYVSTSDVPHSSKTKPAVSFSRAASTATSSLNPAPLSPQATPASSTQSPPGLIQDFTADAVSTTSASPTSGSAAASAEFQTSAQTLETKVETAAETDNVEKSSVAAVETSTEPSTESSRPLVEALEPQPPVAEGPVKPLIDVTIDTAPEIQMISKDSGEEGTLYTTTVETAIESSVKTGINPVEAVEAPVELLIDVTVDASAPDSGQVGILYTGEPSVETALETSAHPSIAPQEPSEREAPVEGSAESMIDITLIETAVESPVEVSLPPVETRASVAGSVETIATVEASVEREQATSVDLEVTSVSFTSTLEPSLETTVDPSGDATTPLVATLETTIATVKPSLESAVEPSVESMTSALESEAADAERTASIPNAQEPDVLASEARVESRVESSSGNVAVNEEKSESEQMTLESVTLHSVNSSVDSLKTEELLQTKFTLDEEVEKRLQELLVGAEHEAAVKAENTGEDEGEVVSKVLSQWSSLSADLQELEGETTSLMTELVCRIPAAPPGTDEADKTSSASDQTAGANVECVQVEEEGEAMTLESITLSEVEAEVEIFETEALQETSDALEKEADALVKEEKMEVKMEVKMAAGDVVYSDTAEAEILTLDSISEAADAIEAEIPLMMEAMFGSEQGLRQTESLLQKLELQNEMIDQEAGKESAQQEGRVLAAMSVESVTLVEVEAALETLENESLSETETYLENEAEVLAGETRTEVEEGTRSEEVPQGLDVESPVEDLQTDALMEELLFTVPGQIAVVTEAQVHQEVVGANISDGLDPVQRLFLEKIREYNNLHRSSGGPVEEETDYERHLSEETAKLQRLYGGGDLSSFPHFTFTEPELDQDPK